MTSQAGTERNITPNWLLGLNKTEPEVELADLPGENVAAADDDYYSVDQIQFGRKDDEEHVILRKLPVTAYFSDGHKMIDFVLGYHPIGGGKKKLEKARFRQK